MYLKTLTLKGFKSFADPTTIELEPGVTVVVGPNGSGKSNVVDAVAWVLGAQGPRVVRSAKMDDVIFAGTQKRSALGRAEVSLTIDNTSRRLPIDFTEVTVTRTLFRTGESEYAINGAPCRLLDVQELLSDSGVGRQQHVIIGQGQLDAVLAARPEDRRAIVEEAAGVLKYRRRRERAERRLESSESGLARLQDLSKEVQRQLKPLERQAAAALRHEELTAESHGLRLHLARAELGDLHERMASGERRRTELDAETAITGADLARTWSALALAEESPVDEPHDELSPLLARVEAERERARRVLALCRERRRATAVLVSMLATGAQIARVEEELGRVVTDLARTRADAESIIPEWEELARAEAEVASDEADLGDHFIGDDESLGSELEELRRGAVVGRERLASARERHARTTERVRAVAARAEEQSTRLADLHKLSEALAEEERAASEAEERLRLDADACREASHSADEILRLAEERVHLSAARVEALELALDEARARAGVERLAGLPGVIGTLLDVVEIADGVGKAVEAALESALAGVLVAGADEARAAIDHLRHDELRGTVLPLLESSPTTPATGPGTVPAGVEELRGAVRSSDPAVEGLLDRLLHGVWLCRGDLEAALLAAESLPDDVIVTLDGDRLSAHGWRLGAGGAGVTRAALESARTRSEADRREAGECAAIAAGAATADESARVEAAAALRRLDQARAAQQRHVAEVAELLPRVEQLVAERAILDEEDGAASVELAEAGAYLETTEARLEIVERADREDAERREARGQARQMLDARRGELRGRRRVLEVRAAALEERRTFLEGRESALTSAHRAAHDEQAVAGDRRSAYARDDRALARLAAHAETTFAALDSAAIVVVAERERRSAAVRQQLGRIRSLASRREALDRVLAGVRDRRQRLEIEQTENRVRHEAAVNSLRRDLEIGPDDLGEAPLPHLGEEADAQARLAIVEAELATLGAVNPLAQSELTELEERARFLEVQLDDVRSARRELGQVIGSIDREIAEVFTAAYADIARHFSDLFTTLFPGGVGRLSLTAPDDPLSTGIEIEARPAGRNVRRLSLLSGGERSLVALAFLFAVFRSRPSPFYLMDEVEAALDEVNLRRFLDLVDEFRDEAQLLIVSHQKRTMEVADALFGVTMQPGGSSRVVSEKLRRGRHARADRPVEVS